MWDPDYRHARTILIYFLSLSKRLISQRVQRKPNIGYVSILVPSSPVTHIVGS